MSSLYKSSVFLSNSSIGLSDMESLFSNECPQILRQGPEGRTFLAEENGRGDRGKSQGGRDDGEKLLLSASPTHWGRTASNTSSFKKFPAVNQ